MTDDPEERIAELEQPLIRSAAESEFPAATAPRVGLRLGWALLGLMIIGLIVAGAAIFSGRVSGPVPGRPTTPAVADGRDPVAETSSATRLPIPSSSTQAAPSGPQAGTAVSVAGVGGKRTLECTNNQVSVSGVNNEVVLTGHCSRVDVSGVENTVTINTADAIVVSGLNNRVTFRSGTPELTNSGIGNTLARA